MYKAVLIFFSIVVLSLNCNKNISKSTTKNVETVWKVDFQWGFENDTISVYFNDLRILNEERVISYKNGNANLSFGCYKDVVKEEYYINIFDYDLRRINLKNIQKTKTIDLRFSLQSRYGFTINESINIDLEKGNFIGINNNPRSENQFISIQQLSNPFKYW